MKNRLLRLAATVSLGVMLSATTLMAAELLDVKPVSIGGAVTIEVTADIPMTYTYYNIPGQARAVVDIADADCEKIEPLIVVNKGAVSSIGVDKAVISGMTVSRLIFNLTSQAEISVSQQSDRKKITVSFGKGAEAAAPATPVAQIAMPADVPAAEPAVAAAATAAPSAAAPEAIPGTEDDPLGLDEPKPVAAIAAPPVKQEAAKSATPSYPAVNTSRIDPVVPRQADASQAARSVIKGVTVGTSSIEVLANGRVENYKQLRLSKPERLAIDIPGVHTLANRNISVNKFGVSKIRVGDNSGFTRIVLDAAGSQFPLYEISSVDDGLRIIFK